MDDALYAEETADGKLHLTVAIADDRLDCEGSKLDKRQSSRLTNYLPGFNIPMLPRELSDGARCAPMKCARSWPAA
jgi:exoribonuclease-2